MSTSRRNGPLTNNLESLMAAAWAAQFGIHARIVDKRESKVLRGQADGLQCRTMEIFDSFGFAERILEESNPL